jgi:hypothetical protein
MSPLRPFGPAYGRPNCSRQIGTLLGKGMAPFPAQCALP